MKKLVKMLNKSSKKEKRFLYLSYLLNVFLLSVILMILAELSDTSGLSEFDADQASMMVMAIAIAAIIIIVFFLWLISMEFKGLYDSRDVFNRNIKLMGFPGGKLMLVYLLEMVSMQPVCVIGGCILGEVVYHIYAVANLTDALWLKPRIMVGAVVIHLCVLLLTVLSVGIKCVKQSTISEIRGSRVQKEQKVWGNLVRIGIALALVWIISAVCNKLQSVLNYTDAVRYCQVMKLTYIAVVIVAFVPIMRILFAAITFFCKKVGGTHFTISLKLTRSYWGRFRVMAYFIIFSGALICGLYTLYENCRTYVTDMTEKNIHYQSYCIYDNTSVIGQKEDGAYYTFRYRASMGNGNRIWVTGIDEEYLEEYETLVSSALSVDGTAADLADDAKLMELLADEDFNGIILPFNDLSELGDTLVLNIDGQEIEFKVYAGTLAIDGDRRDAYVSRAYLEKQLGVEKAYNTVYYMQNPESADMENVFISQTKEDMLEETYQYIVKGTGTIELIFWMILICSMFAVCTCLVMSGRDNRRTLAHLLGLGTEKRVLAKIYVYQIVWNLICTIVPTVFLTYVISKGLAYLTLHPGYFLDGFRVEPWKMILLFGAYFGISVVVQLIMIGRTTKDKLYIRILRN